MSQSDQVYQSATAPRGAARPAGTAPGGGPLGGRPETPRPAAPTTGSLPQTGAPRKVKLTLSYIDPWSVLKVSFLFSVAIGIALVVGLAVLWSVVDGMGVVRSVNDLVKTVGGTSTTEFNVYDYVNLGRVLSFSIFVAVVDVLLVMAISTVSAFIYNIGAALVGGLTVTLSDE